jgi:hypothetical protein
MGFDRYRYGLQKINPWVTHVIPHREATLYGKYGDVELYNVAIVVVHMLSTE